MGYKQITNDQLLVIKPFTGRPVKLALKIKGTKNKCAKCTIYSIFRYKVELRTNEKRATCSACQEMYKNSPKQILQQGGRNPQQHHTSSSGGLGTLTTHHNPFSCFLKNNGRVSIILEKGVEMRNLVCTSFNGIMTGSKL